MIKRNKDFHQIRNIFKIFTSLLVIFLSSSTFAQETPAQETPAVESPAVQASEQAEPAVAPAPAQSEPATQEPSQAEPPKEVVGSKAKPSVEKKQDPEPVNPPLVKKEKSSSSLVSARNKEYTKQLYFDTDEKLVVPPPEFEYDLSQSENKSLKMGPFELNEKTFFFMVRPLGKFHSLLPKVLDKDEQRALALVIKWPVEFIQGGMLEMISRDGKVIWKFEIDDKAKAQWNKQISSWRAELKKKGAKNDQLGGFFNTQFGFLNISDVPLQAQKQTFRFCLTSKNGKTQSRLCSQRYGIKRENKTFSVARVVATQQARALVQNENAPLQGIVKVSAEMPFTFYSELASGESYEFIAQPPKLSLMDFAESIKMDKIRVVGFDAKPFGKYSILNPNNDSKLTLLLGFESTIEDPREFWAIEIPKATPVLYFPGAGGGVFKQSFDLSDLPKSKARVFLSEKTPQGTYIDGKVLKARKQPSAVVTTEQISVKMNPKRQDLFDWSFRANKKAEFNRSYLNVEYEGKTYRSYYEMYNAYARELSVRFSAIVSTLGTVPVAEVAYNNWHETLFGMESTKYSVQRWGWSFKYFKSLSQLNINDGVTKADLIEMNLDLKYRFTPGLWTRDESHGLMLSYQDLSFGTLKSPFLGVGWFWARSMPRVFDNLFNLVPFMRYPKWVDMELIYFASALKSGVTPNGNITLNFHGQVLWKKNIFGEAGFGLKRYAFQDTILNQRAELNTFYGTVGLGAKF